MTKINKAEYTLSENAQTVRVSEFRNRADHLMRVVCVDSAACVGKKEVAQCVEMAQRIGKELIATDCKRASVADWGHRERAIERSFSFIARNKI